MTLKKLFPYLVLNVIVSALTMLAVLLVWNALHPKPEFSETSLLLSSTQQAASAIGTLPPLDEETVEIQTIFLPGEVGYEKLSLKNVSNQPVDLIGWRVSNSKGETFTFPGLTLYPGGAVDLYSSAGINTAVALYWNHDQAVWTAGETASLIDSAGNVRSTYPVP